MTNPRRRFLYSRADDPDEYRPGRTETIGCWRLGYGWTEAIKYTGDDKAAEPSPTLPPPIRKRRAHRPGSHSTKRRRAAAAAKLLDSFAQIVAPPPPPVPVVPRPEPPPPRPPAELARYATMSVDELLRLCSG